MTNIDFTPSWYRTRLHSIRNRRRRAGFVGITFLLMGCWFVINEGRIRLAQAELQDTVDSNAQINRLRERVTSMKSEISALREQKKRYASHLKFLAPSTVFTELSHCLPPDVSLAAFHLRSARASDGPRPPGQQKSPYCDQAIRITARALNSEDMFLLIRNLNESALFQEVYSGGTRTIEMGGQFMKEKVIDIHVLSAEYIAQ